MSTRLIRLQQEFTGPSGQLSPQRIWARELMLRKSDDNTPLIPRQGFAFFGPGLQTYVIVDELTQNVDFRKLEIATNFREIQCLLRAMQRTVDAHPPVWDIVVLSADALDEDGNLLFHDDLLAQGAAHALSQPATVYLILAGQTNTSRHQLSISVATT